MRILAILLLLTITGCAHQISAYADGCWRYGILETNNTGKMSQTPVEEIPIKYMSYNDLIDACGLDREEWTWANKDQLQVRACFDPMTDTIYEYRLNYLSDYYTNHEKCHVMLGRKHNSCWGKGYAQFGDNKAESCDWNEESTE